MRAVQADEGGTGFNFSPVGPFLLRDYSNDDVDDLKVLRGLVEEILTDHKFLIPGSMNRLMVQRSGTPTWTGGLRPRAKRTKTSTRAKDQRHDRHAGEPCRQFSCGRPALLPLGRGHRHVPTELRPLLCRVRA